MADGVFRFGMKKLFKEPAPRTRESLPAPPSGMEWVQKPDTLEWRLVKADEVKPAATEKMPPVPVSPGPAAEKLPPRASPATTAEKAVAGVVVDRLPHLKLSSKEDDWELLSDRLSMSSNHTSGGGTVLVQTRSGSIRSLDDANNEHSSSQQHTLSSLPFKLQRTASSSTIDSNDDQWPIGQGVLGVDYCEHVVLPTDTLQGICLAYKVSSTRLRQANHFSGNSLLLAPKKLVIPISKKALRSGYMRVQDTDAKEYKLHAFLAEFPDFGETEAKA